MPCGVGGVPTGAGLVDGGVDQGPWLQERVGGGVEEGEKCGRGYPPELAWWTGAGLVDGGSGRRGKGSGGGARASVPGG